MWDLSKLPFDKPSEGRFLKKLGKLWWIWALVALGIAAILFARPQDIPADSDLLPAGISATDAEPLADELPAVIQPVTAFVEPEALAVPDEFPTEALEELSDSPVASPENPENSDVNSTPAESHQSQNSVAAVEADTQEIAPGEVQAANSPEPEAPLLADEEASETPPRIEAGVAAPDPNLPALSLEGQAQSAAPEIENEAASAPAPEAQLLLGASSPPLSLAHVLPPGVAPAPDQISPSFDLVRVSPDGSAVIAGRAAPGANVQVFSGSIPVAEATASARGEFVIFLNAPSNATLDMNIPAAPEGASLVVSQEDIVILPAAPDAADATPIVVRRTPDALQIVQPAAPAIPGNISLDLVSYTESGAVQLAGRGQPGNVARIYADGVLAGESPIVQGGAWALEISDIAEGRYVLRVDEITPSGDVLSRTESPFQRQFPEADMPESFTQGAKIIVQPGNTLWLMATEAYGNGDAYSQIFTANKDAIRDPDLIYPGQIFSIPRVEE